jgi:hypothetical protein
MFEREKEDERSKAFVKHKYHELRSGKPKEVQHKEAIAGVYEKKKKIAERMSKQKIKLSRADTI